MRCFLLPILWFRHGFMWSICRYSPGLLPCHWGNHSWLESSWGQHGAHLGPIGPRWAPCWPHEVCYLGYHCRGTTNVFLTAVISTRTNPQSEPVVFLARGRRSPVPSHSQAICYHRTVSFIDIFICVQEFTVTGIGLRRVMRSSGKKTSSFWASTIWYNQIMGATASLSSPTLSLYKAGDKTW